MSIANEVDALAALRAQIEDLQTQYDIISTKFKNFGDGEYDGTDFTAHVYEVNETPYIDASAAVEKLRELGVSDHWFAENTKTKKGYIALKLLHKKRKKK